MKILINVCFGGFGLSEACIREYAKRKGLTLWVEPHPEFKLLGNNYWLVPPDQRIQDIKPEQWCYSMTLEERQAYNDAYSKTQLYCRDLERTDPTLISVVEDLGSEVCSGKHAKLKVVEIPDDVQWEIAEYDGTEHVAEKHRTWY